MNAWGRKLRRLAIALLSVLALTAVIAALIWQDRPRLDEIDWPASPAAGGLPGSSLTVTWLGVATLLFDDGDTQILIDGFFSRPSLADLVLGRAVDNDAVTINYAMSEFRMRRLAAIVPVHSHFDHAMDVGEIANRSSASVVGSESTANIARGAGVPEEQITIAEANREYAFGEFRLYLKPVPHAPIGWRGSVPFPGTIDSPLVMPQPASAFRMGGAWSIVVAHPQGTVLVQGSAGFEKYALKETHADVVFLGVGQVDKISRQHAELLWQHTVTATGARSVYPIHFDDLTQDFGDIKPMPRAISNVQKIAGWLQDFRDRWDADTELYLPEFGVPIPIYGEAAEGS